MAMSAPSADSRRRCPRSSKSGVDHFLVPTSQSPESLEQARVVAGDDVEIIPVATLDEALAALERLGGDPLPLG